MRAKELLGVASILVAACGGDDPVTGDAGRDAAVDAPMAAGAIAVFDAPATGALSWGAVPFPHDLYLGDDGTVDIAALHLATPVWEAARGVIGARRGFCTTCGVYFPIDGRLDMATVPGDAAPSEMPSADDAIVLVDVDPSSTERGTMIPLRVEWIASRGLLSVRPARGIVLAPARTYAAALTSRLLGEDGTPLAASPLFLAARDVGGDERAARVRALHEPALETLETVGVAREQVVSLAVFTTDSPLEHALALRGIVESAPAPVAAFDATADRVWRGAELDELLGQPSVDRPGLDVPPMAGELGARAIVHDTVGVAVTGSFTAPRVVEGDAGEDGPFAPRLGADGMPEAGPAERVPFTLIVPSGADVTALPVMVFHTGLGDTRQLAFALADTVGAAGMAILAIDPFTQGERATSAVDDRHWLRDDMDTTLGGDGMAEHNAVDVNSRLLGFGSAEPTTDGSPIYMLGTLSQQVSDDLATIRLVREGDWTAIAAAAPELAGLAFDASRVFFFGGNQGAGVGAVVLSVAEGVGAASLYSPFGSWIDLLAEAPILRTNFLVIAGTIGATGVYDEVSRRIIFDPSVDLFRWVIEPMEPAAAARGLYVSPAVPARPHLLLHLLELDEWVGPPTSEALASAAGIPGVGVFDFANVEAIAAPVTENVTTPEGDRTVVAYEVAGAGHFAALLSTDTKTVAPPIVPPFTPIDPPEEFAQPVVEVHAQLERFLRTFVATGIPEVCDLAACE